jgi:hypothetical protein
MQREQQPGQGQEGTGGAGQAHAQATPVGSRRYRSLFWAIVLIGAGIVALLFNLDVISPASLGMLSYVWPILLIGVGVDLLFGRRSLLAGSLVGVVTVGVIVVLMVIGPSLGWTGDTELRSDEFTIPVAEATSAQVDLDTGRYSADIHALPVSSALGRPLLYASVAYRGTVDFQSSGEEEKIVSLSAEGQRWWWPMLDLGDARTWEIGLDCTVPLNLSIESSAGSVEVGLLDLRLTGFEADMSSGEMHVLLPESGSKTLGVAFQMSSGDLEVEAPARAKVDMSVDMSSGDARIYLGEESEVTFALDVSSGEFTLVVAPDQALRVEANDVSSGDIDLPAGLVQVERGEGAEGTWETQGYSGAAQRVVLVVERMSSGSVKVDYAEGV